MFTDGLCLTDRLTRVASFVDVGALYLRLRSILLLDDWSIVFLGRYLLPKNIKNITIISIAPHPRAKWSIYLPQPQTEVIPWPHTKWREAASGLWFAEKEAARISTKRVIKLHSITWTKVWWNRMETIFTVFIKILFTFRTLATIFESLWSRTTGFIITALYPDIEIWECNRIRNGYIPTPIVQWISRPNFARSFNYGMKYLIAIDFSRLRMLSFHLEAMVSFVSFVNVSEFK